MKIYTNTITGAYVMAKKFHILATGISWYIDEIQYLCKFNYFDRVNLYMYFVTAFNHWKFRCADPCNFLNIHWWATLRVAQEANISL